MITDQIPVKTIPSIEDSLSSIESRIKELSGRDWTSEIANAVRRNPDNARNLIELEREAADDLRLLQAKKIAYEQKLAELKEEERAAKLGPIRADHAKAITDCGAALKQAKKALDALNRALSDYEGARAAASQAIQDEFALLDYSEDFNPNEFVLSKPGQAGLGVPISRELAELCANLGGAASRAGMLADRLTISRILAPSIEITSGGSK